jgi:hypothetical protein
MLMVMDHHELDAELRLQEKRPSGIDAYVSKGETFLVAEDHLLGSVKIFTRCGVQALIKRSISRGATPNRQLSFFGILRHGMVYAVRCLWQLMSELPIEIIGTAGFVSVSYVLPRLISK